MRCGLLPLQSLPSSLLLLSLVTTACLYGLPHQLRLIIHLVAADDEQQQVDCHNQTCGRIHVAYPFKLANATACVSFSSDFDLECDSKTGNLLFNKATAMEPTVTLSLKVLALTNDSMALNVTDATVAMTVANQTCSLGAASILLPSFPSPYVFSDDNKLGSFGCAYGIVGLGHVANGSSLADLENDTSPITDFVVGGCDMLCPRGDDNPQCGHQRCCVFQWPRDYFPRLAIYSVQPSVLVVNITYDNETCSSNYGTLFHSDYSNFQSHTYGVKLKWALPSNQNSTEAIKQSIDYACSGSAVLTMVPGVPGYLCSCPLGYKGDGYTNGSACTDINECEGENDCIPSQSKCHNIEGNYECKCNSKFKVGDGRRSGSGCNLSSKTMHAIIISISILCVAMLVLALFFVIRFEWEKRRRRKYFKENAGDQVQNLLLRGGRWNERRSLFKLEELQVATDNFSNDMRLGVGGSGTVFKGVLKDGRVVAIKKANKKGDPTQFVNELEIMLQINHRSIVKFLGCCLETVEPLLVYEFASNGTVMKNLSPRNQSAMDWEQRLKVARQAAEALAYLHGAIFPPILHLDVKSSNVLLDNNFNAKVADFGASRLVPEGESHALTAVQGTIGYLDPEYLQTLVPTEKSDVYSFGVMLVELITGLKPIDKHREDVNLALLFIHHMDEDKLEDIIDRRLDVHVEHIRSSIFDVASLALRCLSLHGPQRPSMTRAVEQLTLNITSKFPHANEADVNTHEAGHGSYGVVGAQGFNFSIQEFCEPSLTSTKNMEIALLTMPR